MDLENGNSRKTSASQNPNSSLSNSNFSTPLSNDRLSLPAVESTVIPVHTGSSYPNADYPQIPIMIPRTIYRSESTEAQISTRSPIDEDDSDESLIDSLEDQSSPSHSPINEMSVKYEKGEAFFVPIVDSDNKIEFGLASNMPDRLRDKLTQRQKHLDHKKQEESTKKQKKMKKIIDRNKSKDNEIVGKHGVKMKTTISSSSISSTTKSSKSSSKSDHNNASSSSSAAAAVLSSMKASKNKFLRTEVGLLETYTIDARGNIKFKAPQKVENCITKRSTSIVTGKPVVFVP